MAGRLTRLALAAAMLAAGAASAGADGVTVILAELAPGDEALVDIISIDDPRQRQAVVIKNHVPPADGAAAPRPLRVGRGLLNFVWPAEPPTRTPYHFADLPPGAYTVYVRDLESGEHWPSKTVFVQPGGRGFVVMRRTLGFGGGEGSGGQGGQGGQGGNN